MSCDMKSFTRFTILKIKSRFYKSVIIEVENKKDKGWSWPNVKKKHTRYQSFHHLPYIYDLFKPEPKSN